MSASSRETLTSRIVNQFAAVLSCFSMREPDSGLRVSKRRRATVASIDTVKIRVPDLPPCKPLNKMELSEKDQLALMRNALYEQD